MSSTTLVKSLSERVEAVRAANVNGPEPGRLPLVATRSAIVDLLLEDLAAAVPAPLAAPLRAADSPGTALDWLFAGAVYLAVADDPYLAGRFLVLVADDPRAAGLAMATALASKQEPPPRSAAWHRRDRLGLAPPTRGRRARARRAARPLRLPRVADPPRGDAAHAGRRPARPVRPRAPSRPPTKQGDGRSAG